MAKAGSARGGAVAIPPKARPDVIGGRYRVAWELARGGMGVVYAARDSVTGKRVAVKRLLADVPDRPRAEKVLRREYHVLAGLRHPCIIEVYEFGVDREGPFYSMELLEGRDLHELAPLSWRAACIHLRDIASSLAMLHARHLLHRDVSPRNVRLDAHGRAKLLDFGTLATFGVSTEVVGTPPCVPKEQLHGLPLDQRADLYGLGAVAYWLLTGRHAYPARSLGELPDLWARRLSPPSRYAPGVPRALDDLVMALLHTDPLARPASAAEVIDRLSMVAELDHEPGPEVERGYLYASRMVARDEEFTHVRRQIRQAAQGEGGAIVVEGERGMGITRLLDEAAVEAQLAGSLVLRASGGATSGPYGVAHALAGALVAADPVAATASAWVHGELLRPFVATSRNESRPLQLADEGVDFGELRARTHRALSEWLLRIATERALVIVVDDVHLADDSSVSLLATLARNAEHSKLLLVCGIRRTALPAAPSMVHALRESSRVIPLRGLLPQEVERLVATLFGPVPDVRRLAHWLHDRSGGNPLLCVELARHLVDTGVVRYADGTWVMPHTLPERGVPVGLEGALAEHVAGLSPGARHLAEMLSIGPGSFPIDRCLAVADTADARTVFAWLDELIAKDVIVGGDTFRFRHDGLREVLARGIDPARRLRAHRRLAELLLAEGEGDLGARMEAGWHLLQGGEALRGADLIVDSGLALSRGGEAFAPPSEMLEAALRAYEEHGRAPHAVFVLLCVMTAAGWYGDRRLAERYGERAIDLGLALTGLARVGGRRSVLGRSVTLAFELGRAAVKHSARRRDTTRASDLAFPDLVAMLVTAAAYRAAVATTCLDVDTLERLLAKIEPLSYFPQGHVARIVFDYFRHLALTAQGREAEAVELGLDVQRRLDDPRWEAELGTGTHHTLLAGLNLSLGAVLAFEDRGGALNRARRIEEAHMTFYAPAVSQLRMLHHIYRGEADRADAYRHQVETHAIQGGTTWQTRLFIAVTLTRIHQMTGDLVALKQECERLERLAEQVPSLRLHAAAARGCHVFTQGDTSQALVIYEQMLRQWRPRERIGWAAVRGNLARMLNDMGEHGQAEQVCRECLAYVRSEDRRFAALYLEVEYQLALAEAGLGRTEVAADRVDALITELADRGPFLRGKLHEVRARIAMAEGDAEEFRVHKAAMERLFMVTKNPALVAQCRRLAADGERLFGAPEAPSPSLPFIDEPDTVDGRPGGARGARLKTAFTRCEHVIQRADLALQWFLDETGASEGYLYLCRNGTELERVSESTGQEPPRWLERDLREVVGQFSVSGAPGAPEDDAPAVETTITRSDAGASGLPPREFYVAILATRQQDHRTVVGAVALASRAGPVIPPSRDLMTAAADGFLGAGDVLAEGEWSGVRGKGG